jgi:predicted nucleotide-binding protein (sugar kinase/HSP70/actin superfamily)
MPTPPDPYTFTLTAHNQAALEELATAIEFAQGSGTFTLLLVRCNYRFLQQQMVAQAVALLETADLAGPVHVLTLQPQDTNLYARVQDTVQGQRPGAVMVVAFDAVDPLDNLLVEINKRREEFRRNCPFPLVLWLNDDSYRHLQTLATDFESIAGGETIEFTLPTEALINVLEVAVNRYFKHMLQPDVPLSFQELQQEINLGYLETGEVDIAITAVQGVLSPDLYASLALICTSFKDITKAIPLLMRCADYWETTRPPNRLRHGLSLFYLGLAQYQLAEQGRTDKERNWQDSFKTLKNCQETFEVAKRHDLIAKVLIFLGQTLEKLHDWKALENLAYNAIDLHQRYGHQYWFAQDYGFLARSAVERQQWPQAKQIAQEGLTVVEQLIPPQPWLRQLYLVFLARAEENLNNSQASLQALEAAHDIGDQGQPSILVELYQSLQRQYRRQGRYLDAFEAKQRRLTVEQQYGLRAFVGARRLRAQRQELNPEKNQADTLDSVALEIISSGRQSDLDALLNRLSRSDYKVIVLHGDSGVGKSSLVNGGLIPALQQRAMENRDNIPLLLRQYADWAIELEAQLTKSLNRNRRWATCIDTAANSPRQRLLHTLQRCEPEKLRPILVFDQFEEFFFSNPDRLGRQDFFHFVADCLDLQPSALKVIFSLREDYIHYLLEARQLVQQNGLAQGSMARSQLEDILGKQVLYQIGNFTPEDARKIIETLTERSKYYLELELIDHLVKDLAGDLKEVRPIELQIVGAQLQTEKITTLEKYRQLGKQPIQTLVRNYLKNVVSDCGDDNHRLANLVLFLLTDERGTRPLKNKQEIERELSALGMPPQINQIDENTDYAPLTPSETQSALPLDMILQILTGSGIILHLKDLPNKPYQLIHDYLVEVIRETQPEDSKKLMKELSEARLSLQDTKKLAHRKEQEAQENEEKANCAIMEYENAKRELEKTRETLRKSAEESQKSIEKSQKELEILERKKNVLEKVSKTLKSRIRNRNSIIFTTILSLFLLGFYTRSSQVKNQSIQERLKSEIGQLGFKVNMLFQEKDVLEAVRLGTALPKTCDGQILTSVFKVDSLSLNDDICI